MPVQIIEGGMRSALCSHGRDVVAEKGGCGIAEKIEEKSRDMSC